MAQEREDTSPHSSAMLVSEDAWIQPGAPFTLGLRLSMDPGWHSYWENPGDSGEPTEIEWDLPERYAAGDIQWPYPERIDAPPFRTYGYSDEVLLLTEITPPADLQPGTRVDIEAMAYWLICEEICLPAEEAVSITLPVKNEEPAKGPDSEAFSTARSRHSASLEGWEFQAVSNTGSYALRITPPAGASVDMEGAYFFPSDNTTLEHAAPQPITRDGDTFLMALQQSEYAAGTADRLRGALVAGEGNSWDTEGRVRALRVDAGVEDAQSASAATGTTSSADSMFSLGWLLIFGFLGGLLLNLMPCVFPVLSIKILGFAQHGDQDRATMTKHGFVFGFGVIASFWVLAILLLALRAAGNQIGWGFQLQSPLFVAGMALLFFAIGLNLMGVFEIGGQLMRLGGRMERASTQHPYRESFLSGVLATLVATPCTAPFMGAALGAAIVLPAAEALMIFTSLGVGMAVPYVVFSMTPALVRRLPGPGPWMETFKQVLAFPMLATTTWLVWVFGNQTGIDGTALLLIGLLFLGLALWVIGRWPAVQISSRLRAITRGIAVAAVLVAALAVYSGASYQKTFIDTVSQDEDAAWQAFSTEQVESLRAEGRPVFVDFTAAWCLTCQVNKRTTLNTPTVQAAFREKGVALFQADWTNQDAEITRALEAHGRSGVPLYVLYTGSTDDAFTLLPEILTESIVLDALASLPDRSSSTPM